jgi:hypothetical protein
MEVSVMLFALLAAWLKVVGAWWASSLSSSVEQTMWACIVLKFSSMVIWFEMCVDLIVKLIWQSAPITT